MTEIMLYGEVGFDFDATWLDAALDEADDDVTLLVHSPGGDVFEGVAINSVISRHRRCGQHIEARVEGLDASAASYMCAACDQVILEPGAAMLIHDPSAFCMGRAHEMREAARGLDACKASILDVYTTRAKVPRADIDAAMADETWLTADEAVEWGLADGKAEATETEVASAIAAEKWSSLPTSQEYAAFCGAHPECSETLASYLAHAGAFAAMVADQYDGNRPVRESRQKICMTDVERGTGEAPESESVEATDLFCDGWNVYRIRPKGD